MQVTRKTLLLGIIDVLTANAVEWVLVGDTRSFPETIPSDADFGVGQDRIHDIPRFIAEFAAEQNVLLIQQLEHQPSAWSFILGWLNTSGTPEYFILDFCGDYLRYGRKLLLAEELLSGRRLALDTNGGSRGFFVAAPAAEFTYYLVKKVDKLELTPAHGDHLTTQWNLDPAGSRANISRFWSGKECGLIAEAAERNGWSRIGNELEAFQKSMRRRVSISAQARWFELQRIVRRTLQPTGLMIAVLGPDGSGKSSAITGLGDLLLPAFRRAEIYHFRPHFRDNQPAGPTVTSPHAEPARPPMVSTLKLIFLLTVFTIGYWIRIRPKLVRTTLVIFDRYYHDLLVDPRRYRFKHPLWLARILGRFIPTPDLWLVLDASAETLHSRKQEVPFLESARQRLAYADLGKRLANSHIVDASAPMEKVAGQCVSTILQHMAWRQQIRYRLLR
jgi:thymidylate kinase